MSAQIWHYPVCSTKSLAMLQNGRVVMDLKSLKHIQIKIQCLLVTYIHSHDKKD